MVRDRITKKNTTMRGLQDEEYAEQPPVTKQIIFIILNIYLKLDWKLLFLLNKAVV